ncbi:hypothetical protein BC940DRAFT_293767 [Gongronella butleri]|nr:hypothetical protein BC940DRAFT_293767 [Gongronella butleri]
MIWWTSSFLTNWCWMIAVMTLSMTSATTNPSTTTTIRSPVSILGTNSSINGRVWSNWRTMTIPMMKMRHVALTKKMQ